jgi:SAM-dependent methyltransferase
MKTAKGTGLEYLTGFDTQGDVFVYEDRVFRGIYKGGGRFYKEILERLTNAGMFGSGIVETRLAEDSPLPERDYDLVLEHQKVPFITYPHEWSPEMLKDAALFHLGLSLKLAEQSLIIKDFHPWNILFDNTRPVFVDFSAITFSERLIDEDWLEPADRGIGIPWKTLWDKHTKYFYQMYARMFVPYFSVPLKGYAAGQYKATHQYILTNTMNAEPMTGAVEKPPIPLKTRIRDIIDFFFLRRALLDDDMTKSKFIRGLKDQIHALNVSSVGSAYAEYYKLKGEDFPFEPCPEWKDKQRVVHDSIRELKPRTVLDVGANTGWFSVLAAKQGCRVVAIDIDDECINQLYSTAKEEDLDILPLVVDFLTPTPEVYSADTQGERRRLLLPTQERLKCDMVIALALVHHLALGHNLSLADICDGLSAFSNKYLVLEFVDKQDSLIQDEPDFFPAYDKDPGGFEWYNLRNLVSELERYFDKITVRSSTPDTRNILVCEKS